MIDPGEYYVSDQDVVISTLLGSCISACLYDPVHRVVGMNHFLISKEDQDKDSPVCDIDPGKYGICAMESLIDEMLITGAQRKNLHAKIFGGGSMFKPFEECSYTYCVGNVNGIFIRKFLRESGICLVSEDLGGNTGRVIRFHSENFTVYVKKMRKNAGF
ncbi:chemotaxis protein CheD [Desulfococcaceae bacterium HSG8]|nr:chemotaxis protein CheD [Desulfococcaceae bacterium HSG8]